MAVATSLLVSFGMHVNGIGSVMNVLVLFKNEKRIKERKKAHAKRTQDELSERLAR